MKRAHWNWFLLSSFFAYQYLLRIYPGIYANEIRESFNFSAQEFSKLSTYNIYIYALLQVPFGLLLDRIGIRALAIVSIGLCLLGNYFILHTDVGIIAKASRVLVGIGSAAALMSAFKCASDSLSDKTKGLFMGITFTFGVIAVVAGSNWLSHLSEFEGWQRSIAKVQYVGYVLFIVVLFTLKCDNCRLQDSNLEHGSFFKEFFKIVLNKKIFLYGILSIGAYSPVAALSDLWGPEFFAIKYSFSKGDAVFANLFIFIGLGVGGIFIPMIFNFGKKVLRGIRYSCFAMIIILFIIIYGPSCLQLSVLSVVLFVFGFLSCVEVLCFLLATQLATPKTSGLVVGWVNTMNMLGLALMQQAVGLFLDKNWSGNISEVGIRIYTANEYQISLVILLYALIVCTVIAIFMRSKNHYVGGQKT